MHGKYYNVSVFGINELEDWSKVFFDHGYSYRIEGEELDGELVYAIQVRVTDDVSFEQLKAEKNKKFNTISTFTQ